MNRRFRRVGWAAGAAFLLSLATALPARASVSLVFDDNAGTANAGTFAPNSNLVFDLLLNSTSESVSGVNFMLRVVEPVASGKLRLLDRNLTGSAIIIDPVNADATIEGAANPNALLDPQTELNLGGSTDTAKPIGTAGGPVPAGTGYVVAHLTISIAANTPPGVYTIETFSNPGEGYNQGAFPFLDAPLDSHAA